MEVVLERLLIDLHASSDADSVLDPKLILQNMESVVFSEALYTYADQEYIMALLLQSESPPSVMKFLVNNLRSKDRRINGAKIFALKFLGSFIKQSGNSIASFASFIFSSCVDMFRKEDSGELKGNCLLPIKSLLSLCSQGGELKFVLSAEVINLGFVFQLLWDDLKQSKQTKGTRCEILKTFGLLVRLYPNDPITLQTVESILNFCDRTLTENFSPKGKKEPDLSAIAGSFSCLDRCLFDFEERYVNASTLWTHILKALSSVTSGDLHRYAIVTKALRFTKNHASIFRDLIGRNAIKTYGYVKACMGKASVSKHLEGALLAVLSQLSEYVSAHPTDSNACDSLVQLSDQFLEQLNRPIDTDTADATASTTASTSVPADSVSLLLKCIAAVSPGLAKVGEGSSTTSSSRMRGSGILGTLVDTAEYNVSVLESMRFDGNQTEEEAKTSSSIVVSRTCLFLLAIASTIHSSTSVVITDRVLTFILKALTDTVVEYPGLTAKLQLVFSHSVCLLLHGLARGDTDLNLLQEVLNVFVPSLLARSISISDKVGIDSEFRLLADYFPLWKEIFGPSQTMTKVAIALALPDYNTHVVAKLHSHLIHKVLSMLDTLDLSYFVEFVPSPSNDANAAVNVVSTIVPANLADQELLLNLASFLELALFKLSPSAIACWVPMLLGKCIQLSESFCMVSPLYRMIGAIVKAAEKQCHRYFSSVVDLEVSTDDFMDVATTSSDEQNNIIPIKHDMKYSFGVLKDYIQSLCCRLQKYHGELLSQAIHVVLCVPVVIVSLKDLIPVIIHSLHSDLQTKLSIDALSRYIGNDDLNCYLPMLLPLFEKYLRSNAYALAEQNGQEVTLRKVSSSSIHRKRRAKDGKSSESEVLLDSELAVAIQHSILQFLGRLGGRNKHILAKPQETLKSSLTWNSRNCININLSLPLQEKQANKSSDKSTSSSVKDKITSIKMTLDPLLPRIVELCNQGNDRQLQVVAAETLHGILIYMIGLAATNPARGQQGVSSDFAATYSKLFPVAISLAVSAEDVSRSLFDGLIYQTIHWFSGTGQVHADEIGALVDALCEGISNASENRIRNYCCRGLEEFFKWSVKQSTQKELSANPASVHALMSRLFVLCAHPSEAKRFGAAMTFNKIYKYIR